MDIAELAAEYAGLLPERLTLAVVANAGVAVGTIALSGLPVDKGVVSGNASIVQSSGNTDTYVDSVASGHTYSNHR